MRQGKKPWIVMPALVAGIHVFLPCEQQDVDGRTSPAMTTRGCNRIQSHIRLPR